jgi:hypothetical protein
MYNVKVRIEGTAPLMQHRFPIPDLANLSKGGKKNTGVTDFSQEWREYLYVNKDGDIFQPAIHIETAMVKAAANFKIQGKRGKTFKDLVSANVFIDPLEISHGIKIPEELDADADKILYLDIRPVVIQRARVIRLRPTFKPGWKLDFTINVIDDQMPFEVLNDILVLAGKTVGIGDFRPRFGRFMVVEFQKF